MDCGEKNSRQATPESNSDGKKEDPERETHKKSLICLGFRRLKHNWKVYYFVLLKKEKEKRLGGINTNTNPSKDKRNETGWMGGRGRVAATAGKRIVISAKEKNSEKSVT